MCTNKKLINLTVPDDLKLMWKYPNYLAEKYEKNLQPQMLVKCGKCYECKKENARNWLYKIWLESLDYTEKIFITLTYKKAPKYNNLEKHELQNFIKRLRKDNPNNKIKYFAAGEYGEEKGRPHYHIIILGWQPKDLRFWKLSRKGHRLYRSKYLNKLWGLGIETIQAFHPDTVGYLTLYLNKNQELDESVNKKAVAYKKWHMNELKIKHGLLTTHKLSNNKIKLVKVKRVKDLTKEQHKAYKKDYNELMKSITMSKEPEFQIYSKGMGWNSYIKRKYYKYDMIINNYIYERPKEYLRKVYENMAKYKDNQDLINYTIQEALKRKEHAEQEYQIILNTKIEAEYREAIEFNNNMLKQNDITQEQRNKIMTENNKLTQLINDNMRLQEIGKEQQQKADNRDKIKLYKRHESPF